MKPAWLKRTHPEMDECEVCGHLFYPENAKERLIGHNEQPIQTDTPFSDFYTNKYRGSWLELMCPKCGAWN